MFTKNAMDTPVTDNTDSGPYQDSWFVGPTSFDEDYRLRTNGAPTSWSTLAEFQAGDPLTDADGTPRPANGYPGIDEPSP